MTMRRRWGPYPRSVLRLFRGHWDLGYDSILTSTVCERRIAGVTASGSFYCGISISNCAEGLGCGGNSYVWSHMDLQVKERISVKANKNLEFAAKWKLETHTRDSSDDTRADTPDVMMIARARLEPVPPPGGPFMIMQGRQLRRHAAAVSVKHHNSFRSCS